MPVSRADELITFFNQTRQAKEQAAALDQIIKFYHEFKQPEAQLQPIVEKIESTAAQNQKLHSPLAFELVLGRDDLLARVPELQITRPEVTLERLISEEEARLTTIVQKLPAAKERRVLQALPRALGDRWTIVTCSAFSASAGTRVTAVAPLPMTAARFSVQSRSSGQNWG